MTLPMPRTPGERKAYLEGFHAGVQYLVKVVEDPAIAPPDAAQIRDEAESFLRALETSAQWRRPIE